MLQTTLLIEDVQSNEPSILPDCAIQISLSEYHETTPRFESIEMFVHKRRSQRTNHATLMLINAHRGSFKMPRNVAQLLQYNIKLAYYTI